MSIANGTMAVTAVAAIVPPLTDADRIEGRQLALNNVGANPVYLGALGVTSANGLPLAVGASLVFNLGNAETLYAVCGAALTSDLRYLATKV